MTKKLTVPSLFRKGYSKQLRALRVNQSTFLEGANIGSASRAALSVLGAGKYRCFSAKDGVEVWRLG